MAGLVSELGPARVLGVDTGAMPDPRARILHDIGPPRTRHLNIDHDQIGQSYSTPTNQAIHALTVAARTGALIRDSTFISHALAELIAGIARSNTPR